MKILMRCVISWTVAVCEKINNFVSVYATAEKITTGCAVGGCKGYELTRDLDFYAAASYRNIAKSDRTTRAGICHKEYIEGKLVSQAMDYGCRLATHRRYRASFQITTGETNNLSNCLIQTSGVNAKTIIFLFLFATNVLAQSVDIDVDDNGLIEINHLKISMRCALDGSGLCANATAEKITTGCAVGGCKGYELTRDLDFMLKL